MFSAAIVQAVSALGIWGIITAVFYFFSHKVALLGAPEEPTAPTFVGVSDGTVSPTPEQKATNESLQKKFKTASLIYKAKTWARLGVQGFWALVGAVLVVAVLVQLAPVQTFLTKVGLFRYVSCLVRKPVIAAATASK
ncbi:hypothetical protein NEDG_01354 [Nematocida displodere]|uniref:Uncharacterized protein n=1 Tax=Nematocida displodere TaxID=1805483 RepID=A0A177ECN0_9MICR|nr:hypothetical protein NEDG_01354 [Nematocida displodere]